VFQLLSLQCGLLAFNHCLKGKTLPDVASVFVLAPGLVECFLLFWEYLVLGSVRHTFSLCFFPCG
jgi:hypothetical protein